MSNPQLPVYNRYADALALRKKQTIIRWILLAFVVGTVIGGAVGYLIFFTSHFQIQEYIYKGLNSLKGEDVGTVVDPTLDETPKNLIDMLKKQQKKNILFFNQNVIREKLLAQFPIIKTLNIKKEYFHKIIFDFSERTAIGVWCFSDKRCYNFDEEGVLWGEALSSSGTLLLMVEDSRLTIEISQAIDRVFLDNILKTVSGLKKNDILVSKVEIPTNSLGDFIIRVFGGYYLIFDVNSDIDHQLEVLRVFLENKTDEFKPKYLDLRVKGRIYYKQS